MRGFATGVGSKADIGALSKGCMNVFVKRHLGLRMEDGTPITIKVPDVLNVKLPFFTGQVPGK